MIEKKYQIFISSTYDDLKSERDKAIKTVLSLEQIPIGMEMFNAGDESQWELIKRAIDRTDYYIVIIGYKYGSVDDDGIGYTEKEYDYAINKGIPVMAFIKDNSVPSTPEQRETNLDKQKQLNKFIDKAKNKIAKFWRNEDELATHIATSLTTEMKRKPMIGWIRTPIDYIDKSFVDEKKLELLLSLINEKGEIVLNSGTWDNKPSIYFQDDEPQNPKHGDIWLQPY